MTHFSSFWSGRTNCWLLGLLALPLISAAQTTVTRANLAPAANARAATRTTTVVVPFSQAIAPATASNIRLFSAQYGGRRPTTVSVSGNTVTLTPTVAAGSAVFRPGETVQVTVPATVQSLGGLAATPYVYQFTAAATGGSGIFGSGSDLAVSNHLTSVVVGDLDGDGDLDAVLGNAGGTTVNVRLNDGSGTFGSGSNPSAGPSPERVALGDVDGDGDLDLLTANLLYNSTVSVRFNDGRGSFNGGTDVTGFYQPRSVVLGDVDGDGDLDLVVTNAGDRSVSIRLNNGSGSFSGGSNVVVGSTPDSVVLGDVDSDGDLDLVVATTTPLGTVSIRLNSGSGSFTGGADLPAGVNPTSVTLGDVDGDGDLDLVVTDYNSGMVTIRLNDGSGAFADGSDLALDSQFGSQPTSVALGDVDGDSDLDMVVIKSGGSPRVVVGLNNGRGTFTIGPGPRTGLTARSIALADVDNDGDLDLVTVDPIMKSLVVRLNGGGILPTRQPTSTTALRAYPNPSQGTVQVTGLVAGAPVTVSDMLGRLITTTTATASGVAHLQLPPGLIAGLYLVRSNEHSQRLTVE
jgi:hypothetical protein